jgi:hypothetical protein
MNIPEVENLLTLSVQKFSHLLVGFLVLLLNVTINHCNCHYYSSRLFVATFLIENTCKIAALPQWLTMLRR